MKIWSPIHIYHIIYQYIISINGLEGKETTLKATCSEKLQVGEFTDIACNSDFKLGRYNLAQLAQDANHDPKKYLCDLISVVFPKRELAQ